MAPDRKPGTLKAGAREFGVGPFEQKPHDMCASLCPLE